MGMWAERGLSALLYVYPSAFDYSEQMLQDIEWYETHTNGTIDEHSRNAFTAEFSDHDPKAYNPDNAGYN